MPNQILCPNCGSNKTYPHIEGNVLDPTQSYAFQVLRSLFSANKLTFDNPEHLRNFQAGKIAAFCPDCQFKFYVGANPKHQTTLSSNSNINQSIEERLSQLEQLRKKNLITEEEYKQKREELLRSL